MKNNAFINYFLLGLTMGTGPCLTACGPLLISYIAGTKKNVQSALSVYFLFSFCRVLVYILLSLLIYFFGSLIVTHSLKSLRSCILMTGGGFIVIVGLMMVLGGNNHFKTCARIHDLLFTKDKKNIVVMGIVAGLLPCLPLISILSYIGITSKDLLNSIAYVLLFGIGTVCSPLFLYTLCTGLIPRDILKKRILTVMPAMVLIFLGAHMFIMAF